MNPGRRGKRGSEVRRTAFSCVRSRWDASLCDRQTRILPGYFQAPKNRETQGGFYEKEVHRSITGRSLRSRRSHDCPCRGHAGLHLDQVVVTANREPEKVIDSNADISVVTAKDIEANHYKSVADAVKQVPGVVIATRGSSSQTYFSDPITINGSTNVVVMVDGMRVNTNGLMGTHSQLGILTNMDSVDHIEVLKGSASTLYGSDAAGGVINIITKKPTDGKVHTTLDLSRASFDGEVRPLQ